MGIIEAIKDHWGWAGIEPEEVVGENDFGNLMIRDRQGRYWRMCPEDLYCRIVAKNRAELAALSRDREFLEDWYMRGLVEQAKEALGPLPQGRKYHLVIPAVLGGEYAVSNIKTVSLLELISFSGDLGLQIRDLPSGAQIHLKVVD